MPVSCQFIEKTSGKAITLRELDADLCEYQGIRPDDRRMCGLYDFICLTGIGFLASNGGSEITDENALREYLSNREHLDDSERETLVSYLCTEYTFSAWR